MGHLDRLRLEARRAIEQGLGALLRADERFVNRYAPPIEAPLDANAPAWAPTVRDNWATIRRELDDLIQRGVALPETDELVGASQGADGHWTTYVMTWFGRWVTGNCDRCPGTTALLRDIPDLQVAGFTVLGPGTHIPLHQGPAKSYRWQLGVRIPEPAGGCGLRIGDAVVEWSDGATLAFDDRTPHEAWNDSADDRYVLFIQVPWPLAGWQGLVHRSIQRVFGIATRYIPKHASELDLALNPGR